MTDVVTNKTEQLQTVLSQYRSALVAFSGGIDSTVVLQAAITAYGTKNVVAIVANSELFSDVEFTQAVALGKQLGVQVVPTTLAYLKNEDVRQNTPNSWYAAKKLFYQRMNGLKAQYPADVIFDGIIADDLQDYRPGLKARDEEGIVSPLALANFTKVDVRQLAQDYGLSNWNKVPSSSVSSRFPYNTTLTQTAIDRVMQAESYLRQLGFSTVRVRVHGDLARIEVPNQQMSALMAQREAINTKLKQLGYDYVSVDLGGFISGHMNDVLATTTTSED
ncbi:ATP-dependent sacrificial sulfur transferase LarE [Levilactobacillus suantsaii]|nr:ATP-dependent sacrificial sulfur transferase LarE [Levilactobacillus suantsaii]